MFNINIIFSFILSSFHFLIKIGVLSTKEIETSMSIFPGQFQSFKDNFELNAGRAAGKICENKSRPKTKNMIGPEK